MCALPGSVATWKDDMMPRILRMMTGLVAVVVFRVAFRVAFQVTAACGVLWGVCRGGEMLLKIITEDNGPPIVLFLGCVLACVCTAFVKGANGNSWSVPDRPAWGLYDFLRRAPFVCWCLITDDSKDVPLWAILAWPAMAPVEAIVCALTIVAVPCWWLLRAIEATCMAMWRVLSVKVIDRSGR